MDELADADRDALLRVARRKVYSRHELIFQAGSPGEHVYILESGRVKIYQLSPLGREVIQWFCFPGEVFGLAEVPRGGRREVDAEACTDTDVLSIPHNAFKKFLLDSPGAALLIIDLLACRLRTLGDMLLNLSVDDVSSRVIKLITRLSARYGKHQDQHICLQIQLTHQEMADMIGTSRQTISSEIGKLRKQGILRVENHLIHIERPDLLASLSGASGVPVTAHRTPRH